MDSYIYFPLMALLLDKKPVFFTNLIQKGMFIPVYDGYELRIHKTVIPKLIAGCPEKLWLKKTDVKKFIHENKIEILLPKINEFFNLGSFESLYSHPKRIKHSKRRKKPKLCWQRSFHITLSKHRNVLFLPLLKRVLVILNGNISSYNYLNSIILKKNNSEKIYYSVLSNSITVIYDKHWNLINSSQYDAIGMITNLSSNF